MRNLTDMKVAVTSFAECESRTDFMPRNDAELRGDLEWRDRQKPTSHRGFSMQILDRIISCLAESADVSTVMGVMYRKSKNRVKTG